MRFGLESSSEVSADDDDNHVGQGSSNLDSAGRHPPSAAPSTPRKGILRSAPGRSPTPRTNESGGSASSNNITPRPAAHFDRIHSTASSRSSSGRTRPASTPNAAPVTTTSQKRKELPFERVGLPIQSSSGQVSALGRPANGDAAPLPPWLQPELRLRSRNRGARRVVEEAGYPSSSDDDSKESEASSSSLSSATTDDDASDSEEEQWPVDPGRVGTGRSNHVGRPPQSATRRKRGLARRIRLASVADEWEDWDRFARESALERATASYVGRLRSFTAPADGQAPAGADSPLHQRHRLGHIESAGTAPSKASTSRAAKVADNDDDDLAEVRKLLSNLDVKREDEERKEKEAFEARNRSLWQSIDASILAAEKEAQEAAAAEAERLAAARKAQEEAEQRAKEERENEQRRIEAEKKAKEEQEAKRQKEEQERQKAEVEAQQRADKEKAMGGGAEDIRRSADQDYEHWMAKIAHIKQNILPAISQNPELRKQCFAAKRQITPKVGQLTNSRQEIVRITTAIDAVLSSAKAASATGEIYTWILNHLSKCLIRQAEQETAAKQDTAYPLARVVVWLLLQGHPELGEVLMARLAKKCCWCLAVWPGKRKDQDNDSYRKVLGYRSNEETTENYTTRMAGIFAFFVAVLQTMPTSPPSAPPGTVLDLTLVPEHLRPKMLWTWCVRTLCSSSQILSHPLLPSLWSTFLEVGGNRALGLYGKQTAKVWRLLLEEGIRGKKAGFMKKGEEEGYVKAAIVRLTLLLESWEKQGRIVDATGGVEMDP